MDTVRCLQTVLGIIQVPINLVQAHKIQNRQLRNGLEEIKNDLEMMIDGDMVNYEELKLRELAYDVEDFAQSLWIPRASGPILSAFAMNPVPEDLEKIKHFKNKIEKLNKWQSSPGKGEDVSGGTSGSEPLSSAGGGCRYTPVADLVGIAEPKMKLLELLKSAEVEKAGQQLKVISIVGCPGVGKTAVARAVHDHFSYCSKDFDCVAWVVASGCDNKMALLDKVLKAVGDKADGAASSGDLHGLLADKRYLVVIDDVLEAKVWRDTVRGFPETGKSSRLIVTTRVHSVANVCSSGSYVYRMQCLPRAESADLLWRMVYGGCQMDPAGNALREGSESILSKCAGLPLGLITVGDHMSLIQKNLDKQECVRIGEQLGNHLVAAGKKGEDIYRELRIALEQWYDSLHEYDHKTCMLSLSTFPKGRPIKRKSLARRLICEGLVSGDGHECFDEMIRLINHAQACLDELTNRCIVEPVQICSNSKDVKSCQVKGLMLEFIIHKSQSTNMVTLIREKDVVRNTKGGRIRRLSVQSSTKDKVDEVAKNNMLSETIRSLTIIPSSKRNELFEIKDCKFLRLLDLEGCQGLEKHLDGIYALDYLKYLSLRNTDVKKISPNIKNLQCLQTLDIRDTTEMELPVEVIKLRKLAFLFGRFFLPEMSKDTKEFLSTQSELHTLAGFVVGQVGGFEQIILEARNLKKVKVWCRDACPTQKSQKLFPWLPKTSSSNLHGPQQSSDNDFVLSLQKHFTTLDSVSIHSSQLSQDILASLEKGPCAITCMKLWGQLCKLPEIATLGQLNSLSRLQLSYTRLSSEDLSILQHISCLEYLKLQENQRDFWDGSFVVDKGGFQSLQRLCFQASKLPKLRFQRESMKKLTSLVLLCPDMSQMQVDMEICENISHITTLNEVILHDDASKEIAQAWEKAANGNANWPCVKRQDNESAQCRGL